METLFLKNKTKYDNFDKLEILFNKSKYVTMLSNIYNQYLDIYRTKKNEKNENEKNKNETENLVQHLDIFLKNNKITISENTDKRCINQSILNIIIDTIDEYLFMNPININEYNYIKNTRFNIYNCMEFIKLISEKQKCKTLLIYLDQLHQFIFNKIILLFKDNADFHKYFIINKKYKIFYEKDTYNVNNKNEEYFMELIQKEKYKIFHFIIFTLKIKEFTIFINFNNIIYNNKNMDNVDDLTNKNNENELNNTTNINLKEPIKNNLHLNKMYYNMTKYWLANLFIINNFNNFYPNNNLLINHDFLFFISGCYYSIDGMVDKELNIGTDYKKILLSLISKIIFKIKEIFYGDKVEDENKDEVKNESKINKNLLHLSENYREIFTNILFTIIDVNTYNTIKNDISKNIKSIYYIFYKLILFFLELDNDKDSNITTEIFQYYINIIDYCFNLEIECHKKQYLDTLPNIYLLNLTVTKGLSSLYLNFINNNNLISYFLDTKNNDNNDNNDKIKSGLELVELISVYMQIIDDLSDYHDDKSKGIKQSVNILDEVDTEKEKIEIQMKICLDLLLQIGNKIMIISDMNKEKKDGLFITLLQHWIYTCFKNKIFLVDHINIISKFYVLQDLDYLLKKREDKLNYIYRLLENINFCN